MSESKIVPRDTYPEQVEAAFQVLEAYGVPRRRAHSVANGIQVLVTRMDRENAALRNAVAAPSAATPAPGLNADYAPDQELFARCIRAAALAPNGAFLREIATAIKWYEHRLSPAVSAPDVAALIARSGKQAQCIYIAVERVVADDISDCLTKCAAMLRTLSSTAAERGERIETLTEALKDARYALYGTGPGNPKIDAALAPAAQDGASG